MSFEPLPRTNVGRKQLDTVTLQLSGTMYVSQHLTEKLRMLDYACVKFYIDKESREIAFGLEVVDPTGEAAPIRRSTKTRGVIVSSTALIRQAQEFGYPLNKRLDYKINEGGLVVLVRPTLPTAETETTE